MEDKIISPLGYKSYLRIKSKGEKKIDRLIQNKEQNDLLPESFFSFDNLLLSENYYHPSPQSRKSHHQQQQQQQQQQHQQQQQQLLLHDHQNANFFLENEENIKKLLVSLTEKMISQTQCDNNNNNNNDDDNNNNKRVNISPIDEECELISINCYKNRDLQKLFMNIQKSCCCRSPTIHENERTRFTETDDDDDVVTRVIFIYGKGPQKNPTGCVFFNPNIATKINPPLFELENHEKSLPPDERGEQQQQRRFFNACSEYLKHTGREEILKLADMATSTSSTSYLYCDPIDEEGGEESFHHPTSSTFKRRWRQSLPSSSSTSSSTSTGGSSSEKKESIIVSEALKISAKSFTSKLITSYMDAALKVPRIKGGGGGRGSIIPSFSSPSALKIKKDISDLATVGAIEKKLKNSIFKKMPQDALTNTHPIRIRKSNKLLSKEISRLKLNEITHSQFLKQLGVRLKPNQADMIDTLTRMQNLKDFPEPNIKIHTVKRDDFIKKIATAEDLEIDAALKRSPSYPPKSGDTLQLQKIIDGSETMRRLDEAIAKTVVKNQKNILKVVVKGSGKVARAFIQTRFAKLFITGGIAIGVFKYLVIPYLYASSGCHINFVNPNTPGSVYSEKIIEYSCDNGSYWDETNRGAHPFHREIELWEEENPTGGKVYSYDNYFYAPVRGYPHCSANDVKIYGSCGGWGSFGDGFPLSTKFDMSKMDKGTSITCDETPGIIEAAADILVSVGGEVVEAVADKTMETGKNIFSNLKAKIFNSPTYSMGLALACSFLTLFVTKRIGLSFFVFFVLIIIAYIYRNVIFPLFTPSNQNRSGGGDNKNNSNTSNNNNNIVGEYNVINKNNNTNNKFTIYI